MQPHNLPLRPELSTMKRTLTYLAVVALLLPATSSRPQSSTTALLDVPATASDNDPSNSAKSQRLAAPMVEEDRTWFEPAVSWIKTTLWIALGKSEEEVKEMLGMKGLTETGFTTSKNYKQFENFQNARESQLLDVWSSQKKLAHDVWEELKLQEAPPGGLEHSANFKLYERYLKIEDDNIWERMNDEDVKKWDEREGEEELNAKTEIWKSADRPPWYVKSRLNLHQGRNACRNQPNFVYFRRYLDETDNFLSKYYLGLEEKEATEKRIAALAQHKKHEMLRTWSVPRQRASGTL